MEVKFADTFFSSLKRVASHNTWWYKIYETVRYDIPRFFENLWKFRKEIYEFRSWDYSYNLSLFRRSLEITAETIETHGMEVVESRMRKVVKMKEAIQILNNIRSDSSIERAESELGDLVIRDWDFVECEDKPGYFEIVDNLSKEEEDHNSKVYERSREIDEEEWKMLWKILQGQDPQEYKQYYQKVKSEGNEENAWDDWFDGSGMRNWWD